MNKLMVINKENKKAKAVVIAMGIIVLAACAAVGICWIDGVHEIVAIDMFVDKVDGAVAGVKM